MHHLPTCSNVSQESSPVWSEHAAPPPAPLELQEQGGCGGGGHGEEGSDGDEGAQVDAAAAAIACTSSAIAASAVAIALPLLGVEVDVSIPTIATSEPLAPNLAVRRSEMHVFMFAFKLMFNMLKRILEIPRGANQGSDRHTFPCQN